MALDLAAAFHLVSATEGRDQVVAILRSLIRQVCVGFGIPLPESEPREPKDCSRLLAQSLDIASGANREGMRRPILLVIDNLDGMDDGGQALLELLPAPLPPRCGLLLSSRRKPDLRRFGESLELSLGPLDETAVAELAEALLGELDESEARSLASPLLEVTEGNPLLLQMILRDRGLLAKREELSGPSDVFRFMVERMDGRADEDEFESFLALLALAKAPLPLEVATQVLGIKRRKLDVFRRTISSYLRPASEGLGFAAAQISERLSAGGEDGIDPSVLERVLESFLRELRRNQDAWSIEYRTRFMGELLARLPDPPRFAEMAKWIGSEEFRTKVIGALPGIDAAEDLRTWLQAGGDPDHLARLLSDMMTSPDPAVVVGAILCRCRLSNLESRTLDERIETLSRHPDTWVRGSLARYRRRRLNESSRKSNACKLALLNFEGHFSLAGRFAESADGPAVIITDSFAERLELALRDRVEFMATTLDEVALMRGYEARYLPFMRLLHSRGADAVVVTPHHPARSLADLMGSEVGFEVNSVSPVWFRQLCEEAGLDLSKFSLRPYPCVEDCARALAAGRLAAAVLFEPWIGFSKGRVLVGSGDRGQVIQDVLCVREDRCKELAPQARLIVEAWDSCGGRLDRASRETVARLWGVDARTLARPSKGFAWIDSANSQRLFFDDAETPGGILDASRRISRLEGLRGQIFDLEKAREFIRLLR